MTDVKSIRYWFIALLGTIYFVDPHWNELFEIELFDHLTVSKQMSDV